MKKVALSFSGGKDSCLALHRLLEENLEVTTLITTVMKNETVAHGEPLEKLIQQAQQLRIELEFIETDFATYNDDFAYKLKSLKERKGIDTIAFGDIYLTGHRDWGEALAKEVGLQSYYPLWTKQEDIKYLLREFIDLGYQAEVIKVDSERLPEHWIGRTLDNSFLKEIIEKEDVCIMGESGEYHTFVFDGPLFAHPVTYKK